MPKSTAPIDSRFADLPRTKSIEKANRSARGILMATMIAVLMLFTNMNRIATTSSDAEAQVLGHGLGGEVEQVRAVVVGLDLRPGQQPAGGWVVDLRELGLDVLEGGHRIHVLPHEHDALHLVVLVVTDVFEGEGRAGGPLRMSAL